MAWRLFPEFPVNSEVSDDTSVLQFLEKFIKKKHNKDVTIDNISDWRRAISGDLTSAFNSSNVKAPQMDYLNQKDYAKTINAAKNKPVPNLKWYSENELNSNLLEIQERGAKPSNPLPYDYHVNFEHGNNSRSSNKTVRSKIIRMHTRNT